MQAGSIPVELKLDASLTVERATPLRDEIVAALAGGDSVEIAFSSVEEIDLSCLQVLIAALLSAKKTGKELHFTGTLSQHVSERLKHCGFLGDAFGRAEELESALGLLS
jgi:anti-anti-sigma regulatory factor